MYLLKAAAASPYLSIFPYKAGQFFKVEAASGLEPSGQRSSFQVLYPADIRQNTSFEGFVLSFHAEAIELVANFHALVFVVELKMVLGSAGIS